MQKTLLKVVFIQNVLMCSSYPQTDEPNDFPELDILKSAYKIEDALKFDSSEAFKDNFCTW